ncbi:MAG: DUF1499 domain-containing protein [Acidobacteriota bacterium]|nr:DUF1499 domain-containing protein [Acidobacteriota bacterium]
MQHSRSGWVAWLAALSALSGVALLALAGPGYRTGWFDLGTALQRMLTWAAYAGVAALGLGVVAAILNARRNASRTVALAGFAVVLGAIAVGVPWRWQQSAQAVPRIHDISTDTITPPHFVEAAALRRQLEVPNDLEYSEEVAALQRAGYPDLGPAFLAAPPAEVYRQALELVRARGWEVLAADEAGRRIEATDTTFWFGFKDDIAVRVTAMPDGGSRVDVRSVSRVGRSDIGTNARRIRELLAGFGKS